MTEEYRKNKLEDLEKLFADHGISVDIGGCGCCGSPWVKVIYKGEVVFDDDEVRLKMCNQDNKT